MEKRNEFVNLRNLLLGKEQKQIHDLNQRLSDQNSRIKDAAEILPAVLQRLQGDPELEAEIEKPVVRTIHAAIRRDAHLFAESLYPVMGPAIRRAVTDTFKSIVERINLVMEQSLTVKGLRWRVEAARTGVPFAQVVLKHTLLYSVRNIYLIQNQSGLILAQVCGDMAVVLDEDAVAGMLTVIQSFIQDSLGAGGEEALRSAELGEHTLWVISGPEAALACVIDGAPPRSLRDELQTVLENIHAKYGGHLSADPESLKTSSGLPVMLNSGLVQEVDRHESGTSKRILLIYWAIGLAVLLGLIGWQTWRQVEASRYERQVTDLFNAEPGYFITRHAYRDGKLVIGGLQDPTATKPAAILEKHTLAADTIAFELQPYWSLDHELVIMRLRDRLSLEEATGLVLQDNELGVSGELGNTQWAALATLPGSHALVNAVDFAQARLVAEDAPDYLRLLLGAPGGVNFEVQGDRISVSGSTDPQWFMHADSMKQTLRGWMLDMSPARASLVASANNLVSATNGQAIQFSDGHKLLPESGARLVTLGRNIAALQQIEPALGTKLEVILEGHSDGIGDRGLNKEVASNRLQTVLDRLSDEQVNTDKITITTASWQPGDLDLDKRRVVLSVTMKYSQ